MVFARSSVYDDCLAPAGLSSRNVRLDPAGLPHRFRMQTELAGRPASVGVVLDRDSVQINRTLPSGLPVKLQVPVEAFEAVAVRVLPGSDEDTMEVVLELMHADPALSVPLAIAADLDDVVADWRAWGRVFALPLVLVEADGFAHIVENRLGHVAVRSAMPRRRSVLNRRRPRFLARRRMGRPDADPVVHAGEREITARD